MYYLYKISCESSEFVYYGKTVNTKQRLHTHRHSAKTKKTPLYCWMRKYPEWCMEVIAIFDREEVCNDAERALIKLCRDLSVKILNLAPGGEGGFYVKDKEEWRLKLIETRKGKKPALGMKHSEENKKLFGMYGKMRWDLYGRYPKEVTELSFKEANIKYGISKTHYYRLRKEEAH